MRAPPVPVPAQRAPRRHGAIQKRGRAGAHPGARRTRSCWAEPTYTPSGDQASMCSSSQPPCRSSGSRPGPGPRVTPPRAPGPSGAPSTRRWGQAAARSSARWTTAGACPAGRRGDRDRASRLPPGCGSTPSAPARSHRSPVGISAQVARYEPAPPKFREPLAKSRHERPDTSRCCRNFARPISRGGRRRAGGGGRGRRWPRSR